MQLHGPIADADFPDFLDLARLKVNRCMAPGDCPQRAIAAHSIQKSRFIRPLAEDGHVMSVKLNATPRDGLTIDFRSTGVNQATTFTGLCSTHDDTIFSPIEKSDIDFSSPEHLFLLAYRCTLSEAHEQMESASRVQGACISRVGRGLDSPDAPSYAGAQAVSRIAVAYEAYQYKCRLDSALETRRFGCLRHQVVRVRTTSATVAGNSVYSVDDVAVGMDWMRIHLNVLPVSEDETVVVFSYLTEASKKALRHLRPVLSTKDFDARARLSQFIADGCGNLVFRPSFISGWTHARKEAFLTYFHQTALVPRLDTIVDGLGLFALDTR